jgi:hypothetical protein
MPEEMNTTLMFLIITSKEDVYNNMESLIYHFKIVMGEVPVPVVKFTILLKEEMES